MDVHAAALKHGVSAQDGVYAAQHAVYVSDLDDDNPARQPHIHRDEPRSSEHPDQVVDRSTTRAVRADGR